MAFDSNKPANGSKMSSLEMRNQLNALKALIDLLLPIGFIGGWAKNFGGVPALIGTWAECNGQVLNDVDSPLDGQTLPDLNGATGPQRFLRGASTSGSTGGADTHVHDVDLQSNTASVASGVDFTVVQASVYSTVGPNPASSSLPSYYEVVWVIRIK